MFLLVKKLLIYLLTILLLLDIMLEDYYRKWG